MLNLFTLLYCAISFVGTAAYCVLWVNFTWPVPNLLWLVGTPVVGLMLGISLSRNDMSDAIRRLLMGHALLCATVAAHTTAWPGLVLLWSGEWLWRPEDAVPVSLLPLAPYALFVLRPIGTLQKVVFATVATVVLVASIAGMGLWILGLVMTGSDDHDIVFEQCFQSPGGPVVARHEVRRWSGGVFPDSQGRVWLEVRGLPLQQLVYQYWTDKGWRIPPGGVVRWRSFRKLEFTLPDDSHGGRTAPLLGLRARYSCERVDRR